jgi:RNA polymerase sigma factor (sigma-70 family)
MCRCSARVPSRRSELSDSLPRPRFDPESVLRAASAGDLEAGRQLIDRFTGLLWSVARGYRLSESDAADAVQMTWLRLVERFETVREPDRLAAWLATTCRHECHAILRRQRRLRFADDAELDLLAPNTDAADTSALTDDLHRGVWLAFERLDARCQRILRVLVSNVEEGRPVYAEAAEALQMRVGSLGPTRRRCLDRLREFLADIGISGPEASS